MAPPKVRSRRSKKEETLFLLAPALDNRVSVRLPTRPLHERFDTGDRRLIIEYYGLEIIELSRTGKLRFVDSNKRVIQKGMSTDAEKYFSKIVSKALTEQAEREGLSYDPLAITQMVMFAFCALFGCKNFYLTK
jgi:hypothetical protein